jgi:hypothetical protein
MIFDAAMYMRITLMIDKVHENIERRQSIGICRMYADIWKRERAARKTA